jgi:hypothetical protein
MTIAKKVAQAKTATPAPPPTPAPSPVQSPFLLSSGSVEPVTPSISVVEVPVVEPVVELTPVASEELCASPLAPASITSSHTEESSE